MSRSPWAICFACSLLVLVTAGPAAAAPTTPPTPHLALTVSNASPEIGDLVTIVVVSYVTFANNTTAPSLGPVATDARASTGEQYGPLTGVHLLSGGVFALSVIFNASVDFDRLNLHVWDLSTNATNDTTITVLPSWAAMRTWLADRDENLSAHQDAVLAAQNAAEDARLTWTLLAVVVGALLFELYRLDRYWKVTHQFTLRERLGYVFRFSRGPLSDPIMQILAEDSKVPDVKWDLERDILLHEKAGLEKDLAALGLLRQRILGRQVQVPNRDRYLERVDSRIQEKVDRRREVEDRLERLAEHIAKERKRDGLKPDWHNGRQPHA